MHSIASQKRQKMANQFWLLAMLTVREVNARYKGSALGLLWSLLTPLSMLLVYTFVFGVVFKSRWPTPDGESEGGLAMYALVLFCGLITFQCFAEVVTRAPTLIVAHRNYVTRVVFPLHLLPIVQLGAAGFQFLISLSVLLGAIWLTLGYIPITALWLPVVLAPFCLLIAGFAWYFAAIGPYYRDAAQALGTIVSALMFLCPIFYSRSILPVELQPWLLLNPLTVPVEQMRNVLIYGKAPEASAVLLYFAAGLTIAVLGYWIFSRRRKGFADVI